MSKESRRESQKRWYEKNNGKEKARQRNAKWRSENLELSKAIVRESYAKHRAERLEAKKKYYQEVVKPRMNTPEGREIERNKKARRRALKAGVIADLTIPEWEDIKNKYNHCCAYCHQQKPLEQDHVIPISKGGGHTKINVVPACKSCNSSKGFRFDKPPIMGGRDCR